MLRKKFSIIASVLAVSFSTAFFAFVGCAKDDITFKPSLGGGDSGADHTHAYTRLEVTTPPNKTSYEEGTLFNGEGMLLQLVCSCEDAQTVEEYRVVYQNGDAFSYGDKYVKLCVGEYETCLSVTIGKYGEGSWLPPVPLP